MSSYWFPVSGLNYLVVRFHFSDTGGVELGVGEGLQRNAKFTGKVMNLVWELIEFVATEGLQSGNVT